MSHVAKFYGNSKRARNIRRFVSFGERLRWQGNLLATELEMRSKHPTNPAPAQISFDLSSPAHSVSSGGLPAALSKLAFGIPFNLRFTGEFEYSGQGRLHSPEFPNSGLDGEVDFERQHCPCHRTKTQGLRHRVFGAGQGVGIGCMSRYGDLVRTCIFSPREGKFGYPGLARCVK